MVNLDGTSQQGQGRLNFSYKFGNTVQHPPASTVNNGNSATPNVQRRPGTARRLVGKFKDELGTALVGVAATAAVSTVLSTFNPFGGDPSSAESSAADPSGVDPSGTESFAADPSGVDSSGAEYFDADPSGDDYA